MINAWSLAASVLNNTLDEDYPIMDKTKGRWSDVTITSLESDEYYIPHSDSYYDYTRNDPDAKNPFTDPVDRARAEIVVGKDLSYHDPDDNANKNNDFNSVSYTHLTLPTIE